METIKGWGNSKQTGHVCLLLVKDNIAKVHRGGGGVGRKRKKKKREGKMKMLEMVRRKPGMEGIKDGKIGCDNIIQP